MKIARTKIAAGTEFRLYAVITRGFMPLCLGLCNIIFSSGALAQTNRSVALELQCVGQQALSEVEVTLRNNGNTGTAVVLGTRLGNIYLAKNLTFEARLASGLLQTFTFDNPTFSNSNTGREDPWIVPLPAHSSYSVTISANHFFYSATGKRMDEETAIADIQLRLKGGKIEPLNLDMRGLANWEVLIMDMQSTALAVPDDCR